jgi:hypothetical protein
MEVLWRSEATAVPEEGAIDPGSASGKVRVVYDKGDGLITFC